MNSIPEPDLRRTLHDLADVPGPQNLADRALTGAKASRRRQVAVAGVAAVAVAGLLAAPFLLRPAASQPGFAQGPAASATPSAIIQSGPSDCRPAPSVSKTEKRVAEKDWPKYVRMAIQRLPARTDYVMQSGNNGICRTGAPDAHYAYAVINLGPLREHGHITVSLGMRQPTTPTTCAGIPAAENPQVGPKAKILFCEENTGGMQLVYGIETYGTYRVNAIYADGRRVSMESLPLAEPRKTPEITAAQLRVVVSDPAMAELLS